MHSRQEQIALVNATPSDEDLVRGLLDGASRQHRHLDWDQPLGLLGQEPFVLAMDQGVPVGMIACPPDPPGVAWIRLLAIASGYQANIVWQTMWQEVHARLLEREVQQAAALCIPKWLPAILKQSDFSSVDTVQFLEWQSAAPPARVEVSIPIEPLLATNVLAVAELDRRAFRPIWRHSMEALQKALNHASYATVIRQEGQVAGYQISTASGHGAHLARLAVDPNFQGRGLARQLLLDLQRHFTSLGYERVTVNTQGSNLRSQRLYQNLGFTSLDQEFPVLTLGIKRQQPAFAG